jgi:hypothetical protein
LVNDTRGGPGGGLVDVHPEVGGEPGEAVVVALPDRADLPRPAALVELREDDDGLPAQPRGGELHRLTGPLDPQRHRRPRERGALRLRAGDDDDLVRAGAQPGELDRQRRPVQADPGGGGLVEEDHVGVPGDLAVGVQHQRGDVDGAGDGDADGGRRQRRVPAFGERGHVPSPTAPEGVDAGTWRAGRGNA